MKSEQLQHCGNGRSSIDCFTIQCEPDGAFKPKQCNRSTGYCWCVDVHGIEVDGTQRSGKQHTGPFDCPGWLLFLFFALLLIFENLFNAKEIKPKTKRNFSGGERTLFLLFFGWCEKIIFFFF